MASPCTANPELWFGYPDADSSDGAAKARAYELSSAQARLLCIRRCPLAQQRRCAALAVQRGEEYGVWAGVKLPGGQYRKRGELAAAHLVLRSIAAGEINARQLPENQSLLANHEHDLQAAPTAVFHLPVSRLGSPSAA